MLVLFKKGSALIVKSDLIAYGVFQITHLEMKNWQLLFVLYGSISCLFAILIAVLVPQKLGSAWSKSSSTYIPGLG